MSIIAPSKIRIDKWLFAVRIFKTRTLAADACKSGKIKINGQPAKPAADITLNDEIFIHKGPERKLLKVAAIIENRVGAPQAVLCYIDITPPEMNPHILLKLPGAFVLLRYVSAVLAALPKKNAAILTILTTKPKPIYHSIERLRPIFN